MKTQTRKLTKLSSRSYAIIIPKQIIEKYRWKEKQKLVIKEQVGED